MKSKASAVLLLVLFFQSQAPAAVLSGGVVGDGQTSIGYDPATGEVFVDAPSGVALGAFDVTSAASIFTGDPAMNLGGAFDIDTDATIFKFDPTGFLSLTFGNVAQTLKTEAFILADFTVDGAIAAGGLLGPVDLVFIDEHVWNTAAVSGLWSTAGNWLQTGVPAPDWKARVENNQAFNQTAVVSGNSNVARTIVGGVSNAMTLHVDSGVSLTSGWSVDVNSLGIARVDGTLATGELNVNSGGGVRVELSTPGAGHIKVDREVDLAANATLTIDPGTPPPAGGHLFPIIEADADSLGGETVNGRFGTHNLPADDGLGRRFSVLYENVADSTINAAGDPGRHTSALAGPINTVKIGLARPGDGNFDGLIDALDLFDASPLFNVSAAQVLAAPDTQRLGGAGSNLVGMAPSWREGNWDDTGGSQGIVDAVDIIAASPFFGFTYGGGDLLLGGDATTPGQSSDNRPSIIYDFTSGEILIDTDGNTTDSYVLDSLAGIFTAAPPNFIGGTIFQTDNDFRIAENFHANLSGIHNLGAVAQPFLTQAFLLNDLTLLGGATGQANFEFDLVLRNTPEPSTLLLALGLVGSLSVARRRRR